MTPKMFLMLLVALGLGAAGQTFMKTGLNAHGQINSLGSLLQAMLRGEIVVGLGLFVVSSMLYITLMSKTPLSVLYPMVALNYVFVTVLARHFFGEQVNGLRVAALAVIIIGVTLVGLSAPKAAPANGTTPPGLEAAR